MRYRRNADLDLRSMEREYTTTGDSQLLIPINRKRRQSGLPPYPHRIKKKYALASILAGDLETLLEDLRSLTQCMNNYS